MEIEKLTGEQLSTFEIAYNAAKLDLEQKYIIEYGAETLDSNIREEVNACARGVALNVSLLHAIKDMTFRV